MKKFLVFIGFMLVLASCTPTAYFYNYKRTPSGKHGYLKPCWGTNHACAGIYPKQPIKQSAVRRYQFHPAACNTVNCRMPDKRKRNVEQQIRILSNLIKLHKREIIARSAVMDSVECDKRLQALKDLTSPT